MEYENNVFGPAVSSRRERTDRQAAERSIRLCRSMIDRINIERSTKREEVRLIKIAFDEVRPMSPELMPVEHLG